MSHPPRGIAYAVGRVTIELTAPLTIGSGRGNDLSDSPCVQDSNGLPTIPGSSIAGVLRAAWRSIHGDTSEETFFGHQNGSEGCPSKVEVSWAQVHDSKDRPVALLDLSPRPDDDVLSFLAGGILRDHVRINENGVADAAGKFDEQLVPVGARFTFELVVHGDTSPSESENTLKHLIDLLAAPWVRLGGRTRRGYGSFLVVSARTKLIDLRTKPGVELAKKLPRALERDAGSLLAAYTPKTALGGQSPVQSLALQLVADDYWLFGTGVAVRPEHRLTDAKDGLSQKDHDKVPVTERRISWQNGQGRVLTSEQAEVLVPGSGVRGALRHRTLFHVRRRLKHWAAASTPPEAHGAERAGKDEAAAAVDSLFGAIKDGEGGQPGRVFIGDIRLSPAAAPSAPVQHVSLDRFTQGPMDGLLFSEAPNHSRAPLTLQISLAKPAHQPPHWDEAVESLNDALRDLAEGRLALGSGSNRGHGYFQAPLPASLFSAQ